MRSERRLESEMQVGCRRLEPGYGWFVGLKTKMMLLRIIGLNIAILFKGKGKMCNVCTHIS